MATQASQALYIYSLLNPMHPDSKLFTAKEVEDFCTLAGVELGGAMDCHGSTGDDFGREYELLMKQFMQKVSQ
jgi:hypothetical protein